MSYVNLVFLRRCLSKSAAIGHAMCLVTSLTPSFSAWMLARQIASRLQYLGIQDAPIKRRIDEGPWAGTVYQASSTDVSLTITKEKWNKGKSYISEIIKMLDWDPSKKAYTDSLLLPKRKLNFKFLE